MVFYSEDNEDMAVSRMLSRVLSTRYCGTNTSLVDFVLSTSECGFGFYIDVVPDNSELTDMFKYVMDNVKLLESKNASIVPVPCTEYFVIKALAGIGADFMFKYDWVRVVLEAVLSKRTIAKPYPPKKCGYSGSFRSFEKQCKVVLDNSSDIYLNFNVLSSEDRDALKLVSWYLTDNYGLSVRDKAFTCG